LNKYDAFDQARKEFYQIRHVQDIERKVAKEEALATGAYFGKSQLEIGMGIEDRMFEEWKAWATHEVNLQEMRKGITVDALDMPEDIDLEVNESEEESTRPA
jgi:small subunit ribosomal protein S23